LIVFKTYNELSTNRGDSMSIFDNIDPEQLVLFSSFLAIAISEGRTADELNVLGQFVSTVADSISLIAAQKEFIITAQAVKEKESQKE
jgi:hypothetical protein